MPATRFDSLAFAEILGTRRRSPSEGKDLDLDGTDRREIQASQGTYGGRRELVTVTDGRSPALGVRRPAAAAQHGRRLVGHVWLMTKCVTLCLKLVVQIE